MSNDLLPRRSASMDAVGNQMFRQYGRVLFDYCLVLTQDSELAATAVHDTIMVAISRPERVAEPDGKAWLYAIARNECVRIAPSGVEPGTRAALDTAIGISDDDPFAVEVWNAVSRLSPSARELVLLTGRHRLSYLELGAILGVSPGRARSRANRAHQQLEKTVASGQGRRAHEGHTAAMRHRITLALTAAQFVSPPPFLHEFVLGSSRVPARVLHYGLRAGKSTADGFPRPWDRRPVRPPRARVVVVVGAALVLPVLVSADSMALPGPEKTTPVADAPAATGTARGAVPSPSVDRTPGDSSRVSPTPPPADGAEPPVGGDGGTRPAPSTSPSGPPGGGTNLRVSTDFSTTLTVTCPSTWTGTVSAAVTGGSVAGATAWWSADGAVHSRSMTPAGAGQYRAAFTDLPGGRPVRWWVTVRPADDPTVTTAAHSASQSCLL